MAAGNVETKRPTFRLCVNLLMGAHERLPGIYSSGCPVLVLLMALAALRLGLALKNHRTGQRTLAQWEGIYHRHTQLGLIFVSCLIGGYLLGILSMPWFRERPPFRSPHFFFGTLALLLFIAGGYTDWRLKQGTERYADVRDITVSGLPRLVYRPGRSHHGFYTAAISKEGGLACRCWLTLAQRRGMMHARGCASMPL